MQKYVDEASEQYIDPSGKCRALIYDGVGGQEKLALFIRPTVPTSHPKSLSIPRKISFDDAVSFCKKMNLEIIYVARRTTEGGKEVSVGLVVRNKKIHSLEESYIPILETSKTGTFEKTYKNMDPLFFVGFNPLDKLRLLRKTSDVLKAYVLWSFSRAKKRQASEGEEFNGFTYDDRDSYEVITDPEMEFINEIDSQIGARLYDNDIMFTAEGKLRVPSESMIELLIKWLEVQKIRNSKLLENYWSNKIIPDVYKTISDFRSVDKQLIFVNLAGLKKWIEKKGVGPKKRSGREVPENTGIVYREINLITKDPFFYQFSGRLAIIQNVANGDRKIAEYVATSWISSKRNEGYSPVVKPLSEEEKVVVINDLSKTIKDQNKPLIGTMSAIEEGVEVKKYFAILLL